MTLVQVLQKLRDDLMKWGTANFDQINTNFTTLNSKVSNLQSSSTTGLSDLEKRVSTNETNIASNDSDIAALDERVTVNEGDIDDLEAKTKNIDGTDDSALYIIDSADDPNVVAYFDAEGLHITDIEAQNLSLRDGITQDGEQFFIIDSQGNVAAYIDGTGTHVTNLYVDKSVDADGNPTIDGLLSVAGNAIIEKTVEAAKVKTTNFEATNIIATDITATETVKANDIEVSTGISQEGEEKFFIIDSQGNVAAYIDGTGTHVTNLYVDKSIDANGNPTIDGLLSVEGNTTLSNILTVEGSTILNDKLYVGKETNTNTLNVRSTSNLIGDLRVQSNTNLEGALNVTGHTTVTTLTTSGDANIDGDLEVAGTFKSANLDATDTDSFFIIDSATDPNVIAYFNAGGLYVTDVTTKGIKFENNAYTTATVNKGAANYSVNQTLVDLLNKAIDYSNRITSIEGTLSIVSNVMDFIGVFNTVKELENAHPSPNPGDVAVVIENQTEYIYDEALGWVEFGYSSYTMDKLIELEERLEAEIDDRQNADRAVNYLGEFVASTDIASVEMGDIAVIGGFLQRYNGSTWEAFSGLSHNLYYINGEENPAAVYFIDGSPTQEVVCYIDSTGFHATDIFAKFYLNVEGGATITGATLLGGALTAGSAATFKNTVTIEGKTSQTDDTGLTVSNRTKTKDLTVENSAEIQSLGVIGDTRLTGNLWVDGTTNLADLDVYYEALFRDNVTVEGDVIIEGDTGLTVNNTATIGTSGSTNQNLTVNGSSQFNGNVNVTTTIETTDLVVNGIETVTNLNVIEDLAVGDTISANGNIVASRDVIADGDIRSKNFTSEDSDAVYFIDQNEETGVYIDGAGLHTYTFEAQEITTRYKDTTTEKYLSTTNPMTELMYFEIQGTVEVEVV